MDEELDALVEEVMEGADVPSGECGADGPGGLDVPSAAEPPSTPPVTQTVVSRRAFDFSGLASSGTCSFVMSQHLELPSGTPYLMLRVHDNSLLSGATLTLHVDGYARRVQLDPKTKKYVIEGFEGEELTSLTLRADTTDTLLTSRLREPLPSEATVRCTMTSDGGGGGSATVSVALAQAPRRECVHGDDDGELDGGEPSSTNEAAFEGVFGSVENPGGTESR
jgi:hypothetical protein